MNLRLLFAVSLPLAVSVPPLEAQTDVPPAGEIAAIPSRTETLAEIQRATGPVSLSSPRLVFPLELARNIAVPEIPVTTDSQEARKWTQTGFGFLHLLEFDRAERCFRTALMHDKSCALASFGVAVAAMRTPARGRAWAKDAFSWRDRLPVNGHESEAAVLLWRFYDEKSGSLEKRKEWLKREFEARAAAEIGGVFWKGQALLREYLNDGADFRLAEDNPADFPAFDLMHRLLKGAPEQTAGGPKPATPVLTTLTAMLMKQAGNRGQAEEFYADALKQEIALANADGWAREDLPGIAARAETLLNELAVSGKSAEARHLAEALTGLPCDPVWNVLAEPAPGQRRTASCFLTGKRFLEAHPARSASPVETPGLKIKELAGAIRLPPAPPWTLPDAKNRAHSLTDFHGRPLLLNFYLDHQCERCMHQMTALVKRLPEFEKLGIQTVAIGGDKPEDLAKAVTFGENPQPFPFPLLADPEAAVHRSHGCWHGFSELPQHGTMLVSAEGRILWQNTSEGPFEDMDFLLKECERLLNPEVRPANK